MNDLVAAFDHMKRNEPVRLAAGAVAILGLAAILGAWFFQIVIGLPPCPLCLEQRYAYYFSIPLAVLVLLGVSYGASRKVLIAALAVIALGMLWNAGLGAYHAGVEWKFWEGPQDCSPRRPCRTAPNSGSRPGARQPSVHRAASAPGS